MMRKYVACRPAIVLKYLMQFHHRASLAWKHEDKALFYFLNCDELRGQIKHIKPALMHMEYRIMPKDSCECMPSVGPFDNEMSLTDNLEHPLATCIQREKYAIYNVHPQEKDPTASDLAVLFGDLGIESEEESGQPETPGFAFLPEIPPQAWQRI